MLDRGFDQRIAKELVIRLGRKDRLAVIAALDDVLRLTGDDVTGKSGHRQSGASIQVFSHDVPRLAP